MIYKRICRWCGKQFETEQWHEDCCSEECDNTQRDWDNEYGQPVEEEEP